MQVSLECSQQPEAVCKGRLLSFPLTWEGSAIWNLMLLWIIYRFQNDDWEAANSTTQMSVLARVAFEKYRIESNQAGIKAATLQVQFWDELARDTPNISHLHAISSSMNAAIHKAEAGYQALLAINDQSVTALRGYAAFLLEVMNDPERAMALMTEANRIEEAQTKVCQPVISSACR